MKDLATRISVILKSLRRERSWSLDVASQKTGVSKAMLGQIERGESSPTIATLWKIAAGFNTSFSSFFEDLSTESEHIIHRSDDLKQIHPSDDKIRFTPIFSYDKTLAMEVFVIELLPGCCHISPPHQAGSVEHIIVSHGEMEALVNDTWHPLKENDGMRFNADRVHGYRNSGKEQAVFYDLIHYERG